MEDYNLDVDFAATAWEQYDLFPVPSTSLLQNVPTTQLEDLRIYRPRNPRSCDLCRARKTACRIDHDPPCFKCKSMGLECTFTERSRKRKRHNETTQTTAPALTSGDDASHSSGPSPQSAHSNQRFEEGAIPWLLAPDQSPLRVGEPSCETRETHAGPSSHGSREAARTGQQDEVGESLDSLPTNTAFLLGDTGEADPYLVKHSSMAVQTDKLSFRRIERDVSAASDAGEILDNERPLVFMLGGHSLYDAYEPRLDEETMRQAKSELNKTCSDEVGVRLVKLYFRYVYPYFPVLSRSQMLLSDGDMVKRVQSLPLSLKAALYATGQPFMVYDDYLSTLLDLTPISAHTLWRISWLAITHEIHTPHLSTLQACLLFLQSVNDSKYVMDSPFRWSFVAWTVGLAQSLGLSTDCTTWRAVPAWEKRLRRRLWWATYALDKWCMPSAGLSSHIKFDDYDVIPLTSRDFVSSSQTSAPVNVDMVDRRLHEQSHFYHLVELSRIVADINDTFFSIRGSKTVASNFALTLELARPLRNRLHQWKEAFGAFALTQESKPTQHTKLDGNASLRLAYPVATMILFRALLRPLERESGSPEDIRMREVGQSSVRIGAMACCVEVVQFLEQVKPGVWDAFWHSFSPASFAIASSFMIRLYVTSHQTQEKAQLDDLITRWRWAMRTGSGNGGNRLMSLGLLRLNRALLESRARSAGEIGAEHNDLPAQ